MTMCLVEPNQKLFDDLLRPLELDTLDKSMWNDKCNYIDLEKCKTLNPQNFNLVVLQLNIRSLISIQIELKQLLRDLKTKNSKVDIAMLNETFLTDQNMHLVLIPGYKLITNNRKNFKGEEWQYYYNKTSIINLEKI